MLKNCNLTAKLLIFHRVAKKISVKLHFLSGKLHILACFVQNGGAGTTSSSSVLTLQRNLHAYCLEAFDFQSHWSLFLLKISYLEFNYLFLHKINDYSP